MIILQHSLGIDIRDETLRLVLLGKTLRGSVLVDYLIKEYPGLIEKARESEILDSLVAELKTFLTRNSRPNDVIFGIPRKKVILRELTLPELDKEELKDIIVYEIEKHIPIPSEEIYYDYKRIENVSETEQKILLAIIKKEDLDFYLMLLERADLVPTLATPFCYAFQDCPDCNHLGDHDMNLMVDLGEREIELELLMGNKLLMSRNFLLKGRRLEEVFSISKEQFSGDDQEEGYDPQTRYLGMGLMSTMNQWMRRVHDVPEGGIKGVLLTGLNSYDSYLSDFLHDRFGMDVYLPNPFKGITDKRIPGRKASALAAATGLAEKGLKEKIIDLNLLPEELRVRSRSNALMFTLIFVVLLFIMMTITAYTGLGKDNEFYLPKKMRLEKTIKASTLLQDQVKEVKELSQRIDELSKDVVEIEALLNGRISKLDILRELSVLIPTDAWLDRANIDNTNIELNGYAESSSTLLGVLEDSPIFENVIFPSTITKRAGREKERFRIKANIQKGLAE